MLENVGELFPIGSNRRSKEVKRYSTSVVVCGRTPRDIDSLKSKFEKRAITKKLAGQLSCPLNVQRAKHIARDSLNKKNARTVPSSSKKENQRKEDQDDNGGYGVAKSQS